MDDTEIVFTLFYLLFCFGFVFPPHEFVAAGVTIPVIFSSFIVSEDLQFIQHHVQRTILTIIIHSFLPLGFYAGLQFFTDEEERGLLDDYAFFFMFYSTISIAVWIYGIFHGLKWYWQNYENHPITLSLGVYADQGRTWRDVAADINSEFFRIDKISIRVNSLVTVIAMDNWIAKVTPYSMNIIHQSDASLVLSSSERHTLSPDGTVGSQYLNIEVKSSSRHVDSFSIRVNALDYRDLQQKLQRPIQNISNIVIQQSLSDRFIDAFKEAVERNPKSNRRGMELETCIGCMQIESNVRLQRLCGSEGVDSCVACYCRPMWCLECMAKWFASRQDQDHPETWLSSKCPCSTCRNKFCIVDVSIII